MRGDAQRALDATEAALDDLPQAELLPRARAYDTLGLAHELLGDADKAVWFYMEAAVLAEEARVLYLAVNARCEAAQVQIQQGQLHQALVSCRATIELGERSDPDLPPLGLAHAITADIHREQNRLELAQRGLETAIACSRQVNIVDDLRHEHLYLARLCQAKGDITAGLAALQEAELLLHAYKTPRLTQRLAAHRVRLWLAQGKLRAAERWADEFEAPAAYLSELEEHFVVVNWDQPGTGKSYGALDRADLTVERYVDDAHALVELLRTRFQQERVYLLGESWGTILGIKLVQAYPDLFHAYIGSGQMVNTTQNDRAGYALALEYATARGDTKTVEALKRSGPPPYVEGNPFLRYARYLMVLNNHMAAHASGDGRQYNQLGAVLTACEYGLVDKVNWFRSLNDTFDAVYPQLADLDFMTQATRLEAPVYFTLGRHDVNAMAVLAADYFDVLDAPAKTLIWFERSGHTPLWEESAKYADVLINQVLPETQPRASATPATKADLLADPVAVGAFFDELIPHQLRGGPMAGAAVAVVHDGELRFAKGYGHADLAAMRPVAAGETLLRTDSSGKLFVWTAVMQLVEAGVLDLDADINQYLDFAIPATFDAPITLAHLLSHTAGFEDQGYLFAHSADDVEPTGEFLATHMPARMRPPGARSAYSNYGTALAGYIVERASAMPFAEYAETYIFEPLGMGHSTFQQPAPASLAANLSHNYRTDAQGELIELPFQFLRVPAAGEGHVTVTDMARFMQAHLAADDTPILSSATLAQMHSRLFSHRSEVNGFAYGFAESTINGRRVLRHEGNNPGMSSSTFFLLPEEGVGVYVAYNSNGGFGPGEGVRQAFFKRFHPAVAVPTTPDTLSPGEMEALTGAYRPTRRFDTSFAKVLTLFTPAYGDVAITPGPEGTLVVRGVDEHPLTYAPLAPDHLRLLSGATDSWGDLFFDIDEYGEAATLLVENQPYKAFEKVSWGQRADVQRMVGAGLMLLILVLLVGVLLAWLVQRWRPLPAVVAMPLLPWALLAAGAALMLLFPVALLLTIEEAYLYGVTGFFLGALTLPLLAMALAGTSVVVTLTTRRKGRWGWVGASWYALLLTADMATAWWLAEWNLLGYRL